MVGTWWSHIGLCGAEDGDDAGSAYRELTVELGRERQRAVEIMGVIVGPSQLWADTQLCPLAPRPSSFLSPPSSGSLLCLDGTLFGEPLAQEECVSLEAQ